MRIEVTAVDKDCKIQCIKGIRSVMLNPDLKDAKAIADGIVEDGNPREFEITPNYSADHAISVLADHGVVARVLSDGVPSLDDFLRILRRFDGLTVTDVLRVLDPFNGASHEGAVKL